MNQIQKISHDILVNRLKIQLGIALDTDVNLRTLQAMSRQLHNERLLEMAKTEASYVNEGNSRAA
jgi:hypothetical protein